MTILKRKFSSADVVGLPECAVKSANKRVTEVLSAEKSLKKRRKEEAVYSDKDRASIGRYAAENGNSRALIHFKYKSTW